MKYTVLFILLGLIVLASTTKLRKNMQYEGEGAGEFGGEAQEEGGAEGEGEGEGEVGGEGEGEVDYYLQELLAILQDLNDFSLDIVRLQASVDEYLVTYDENGDQGFGYD